jgi:seryl-tRNA(Sec) selenium transferase
MNLTPASSLRSAVAAELASQFSLPVFTADITSVVDTSGSNLVEFFTVYWGDASETEDNEVLDAITYRTDAALTVVYHNDLATSDQSILDVMAANVRLLVMDMANSDLDIKRGGWQYLPGTDGATAGIVMRFDASYSN